MMAYHKNNKSQIITIIAIFSQNHNFIICDIVINNGNFQKYVSKIIYFVFY